MKTLYETTVRVTGGRAGRATSDDGRLAVMLALPAAIGGSGEGTYGLAAVLDVTLPGLDPAARAAVVAEAERLCAYTNATRGNVAITVRQG